MLLCTTILVLLLVLRVCQSVIASAIAVLWSYCVALVIVIMPKMYPMCQRLCLCYGSILLNIVLYRASANAEVVDYPTRLISLFVVLYFPPSVHLHICQQTKDLAG